MTKCLVICFFLTASFANSLQAAPKQPVFIVMGGYQTCPTGDEIVHLPVENIQVHLKLVSSVADVLTAQGAPPAHFFLTCFSGVQKDYYSLHKLALLYSEDFDAEMMKRQVLQADRLKGPAFLNPTFNHLEEKLRAIENPEIYISSHSYGGWSAVQLAAALSERWKISGLITMDPISPVLCKPTAMAFETISGILKPVPDCTSAPRDIDETVVASIAKHVPWWLNFYQKQFNLLHSGPIPAMDLLNAGGQKRGFNIPIVVADTNPWFNNYHSNLALSKKIWDTVKTFVASSYANY